MNLIRSITKDFHAKTMYLFAFSFALTPFFSSLSLALFSLTSLCYIKRQKPAKIRVISVFLFSFLFFLYLMGLFFTAFPSRGLDLTIRVSPIIFVPVLIVLSKANENVNYTKFKLAFSLGIFISCLVSLVYGLFRWFRLGDVKFILYFDHAALFGLHPTYYSMYIITAMIFLSKAKITGIYKVISFSLFSISLLLLQSKIGILLFIILVLYFTGVNLKKGHRWFIGLGVVVLVVVMTTSLLFKGSRINELFKQRDAIAMGNLEEDGISQRLWLWSTATEHLKERPFFGFGFGSKDKLFEWKVSKDILTNKQEYGYRKAVKVVSSWNLHNNYLQIAYEFGLVGLVFFLLTIFIIIMYVKTTNTFLIVYTLFLIVLLVEVALNRQMGIYYYSFILGLLLFEPTKIHSKRDETHELVQTRNT